MLIRLALLCVVAAGGCSQGRPPSPIREPKGRNDPRAPSTTSHAPLSSGTVTVRGGERFALGEVEVTVDEVTFVDEPCPPNARCIHSGVIQLVHFGIARKGGAKTSAAVRPGAPQIVDGLRLDVKRVRPGPEADIEASIADGPH